MCSYLPSDGNVGHRCWCGRDVEWERRESQICLCLCVRLHTHVCVRLQQVNVSLQQKDVRFYTQVGVRLQQLEEQKEEK